MSRAWLRGAAEKVAVAFVGAFLASLLASPAGIAQLSTLHAAAIAGLGAAAAALYALLGPLQRGAKASARAVTRAASKLAGLHTDAAGITTEAAGRLCIGIYVQTAKAQTSYDDVARWLPALRQQAHAFARSWGLLTPIITLHRGNPLADSNFAHLRLVILDDADQANALGYHDEDTAGPYARVFAVDCEKAGVAVSSCASHELLEALADLSCTRWAQAPDGRLFAVEVCDPVESDGYNIAGVDVSNYVLPSYFDPNGHRPYDVLGYLTEPFQVGSGGYAIVMSGGRVTEVFGNKTAYKRHQGWRLATKKTPLSRTARRHKAG